MSPDTAQPERGMEWALSGYNAPLQVRACTQNDARAWEEFVARHPGTHFFHRFGWKRVVERSLGHAAFYRCAWRNGRLTGILPLILVKSRLFGTALISTGFGTAGGIAADDADSARALADDAARLGHELQADFVELRQEVPPQGGTSLDPASGWIAKPELYFGFRRALLPSAEENLNAVPRKKRADLRKAIANPALSVDAAADIDTFFAIYGESLRNLGTPILPRGFYAAIAEEFGREVEISAVSGPHGPVAALMTFFFKDRVLPYYGGATPDARPLHAYDLMYWRLMERALERGAKVYDFGRSKRGTGAFDYKTYWGFAPEPLAYRYRLVKSQRLPEINPLNPKYRLQIALWRHLPLAISNRLGPFIARQLG